MTTASHHTDDLAVEPLAADKSLGELIREMTRDVGQLIRKELQLAKVEAREEVSHASKGVGLLAGAGLGAWLALLLLSLALAAWLDEVVHTAVAFAIVGALWIVVAAVLVAVGRKHLREARQPLPETVNTLKEDVEWAKQQVS